MRLKHILSAIGLVMLLTGVGLTSPMMVSTAYAADCVIPSNGPWPPCARSGNVQGNQGGCVIPPNGPWPACAANGGASANNHQGNNNRCVIPSSGPWPPCAANANNNNRQPNNGRCVIPSSGPWPPCASGTRQTPPRPQAPAPVQQGSSPTTINVRNQIVHQGRGAKQSTISVPAMGGTIARLEVVIDFTYSNNACAAGGSVARGVFGYSLTSPSGTKVDLIEVAQLSGRQAGTQAQIHFADGAPSPIHLITGMFAPADPLSWFEGEDPTGEWVVTAFKNDWADAICQHGVMLHITTQ